METSVKIASSNFLKATPISKDTAIARGERESSDALCDRLLSLKLIECSDSFVPQELDCAYFSVGHSGTKNVATTRKSSNTMQVHQNAHRHSMLLFAETKASDLNHFIAQSQGETQRKGTTPITVPGKHTYTYKDGLDDDPLQLRYGDSDWDLVDSDDDSECIFPYSPDSTAISCEAPKATTDYVPQNIITLAQRTKGAVAMPKAST